MGNRYYVPPRQDNPIESGINTGMGMVNTLATLKKQQDDTELAKSNLDLNRQKHQLESRRADEELGPQGTVQQGLDIAKISAEAAAKQAETETLKIQSQIKKANTPATPGDIDAVEALLPGLSKQLFVPSLEKTSGPVLSVARKLSGVGLTRREVKDVMAQSFMGSYNQIQMLDGAKKDYQDVVGRYGPESPQAESAKQTLDAIADGSVIGHFFPSVLAAEMDEKRQQEAELVKTMASKRQPGLIERTIDLGNKQRVIYNDGTVQDMPKGASPSTGVESGMVENLAAQVIDGRLDPAMISKRGGLQQSVFSKIEEVAPGFNIVQANANAKYSTNTGNLSSRALIEGVAPLYEQLLTAGKALENTKFPLLNKPINWVKEMTGDPDIVSFNNLRDDTIAETERILLGSGVLSDSKYLRAVKNVNSAQTYEQLQAAVKNLRIVVDARAHALDTKPYKDTGGEKEPGSDITKMSDDELKKALGL